VSAVVFSYPQVYPHANDAAFIVICWYSDCGVTEHIDPKLKMQGNPIETGSGHTPDSV